MDIEFWYRENGKSPAENFLNNLNEYERLKVVDLLSDVYGISEWTSSRMIKAGVLKRLENSLYELKVKICGNFFRFPAVIKGDNTLILLDGFKKKKNKIESKDINRARDLYQEYKFNNRV
jgi:phage-related protein